MKVFLRTRKGGCKWSRIPKGPLERLCSEEQRFARQNYPRNVAWIPGDATLRTLDGVGWKGEEFFSRDAPPLVRNIKGMLGEITIWGMRTLGVYPRRPDMGSKRRQTALAYPLRRQLRCICMAVKMKSENRESERAPAIINRLFGW